MCAYEWMYCAVRMQTHTHTHAYSMCVRVIKVVCFTTFTRSVTQDTAAHQFIPHARAHIQNEKKKLGIITSRFILKHFMKWHHTNTRTSYTHARRTFDDFNCRLYFRYQIYPSVSHQRIHIEFVCVCFIFWAVEMADRVAGCVHHQEPSKLSTRLPIPFKSVYLCASKFKSSKSGDNEECTLPHVWCSADI